MDKQAIQKVLLDAANLLERNGWVKGNFAVNLFGYSCGVYDYLANRWCTAGAINRAGKRDTNFSLCESALSFFANYLIGNKLVQPILAGVLNVPAWNDEPERTKEEVIATLRAAAATLEPLEENDNGQECCEESLVGCC